MVTLLCVLPLTFGDLFAYKRHAHLFNKTKRYDKPAGIGRKKLISDVKLNRGMLWLYYMWTELQLVIKITACVLGYILLAFACMSVCMQRAPVAQKTMGKIFCI